ncbi:MAG TPA: hypothetical protein VJL87_03050, partial [Bdellovibrionota bacterium]|nr:hypothetical protein [Bdellovibrionota bacterium]
MKTAYRLISMLCVVVVVLLFTVICFAEAVEGEFLIQLKDSKARSSLKQLSQQFGLSFINSYWLVPNLYHVKIKSGDERNVIEQLMKKNIVEYAEPNYIYYAAGGELGSTCPVLPNDEFFVQQWGLHNVDRDADIDAPEA